MTLPTAIPIANGRMSRKLDDASKTVRMQIVTTAAWLEQVEEWRASQRPVLNVSAAIRQLVEIGLSAKPKP